MANKRFSLARFSDSLTVAILGAGLLSGKIQGVVLGPANIAIAVTTLAAAVLLLLADLELLSGWRSWSGWWLLGFALGAFALVNF